MAAAMLCLKCCRNTSKFKHCIVSKGPSLRSLSTVPREIHDRNTHGNDSTSTTSSAGSSIGKSTNDRDPHRVLKALANTTRMLPYWNTDFNQISDDYLTPKSAVKKNEQYLARKEGEKAAEYFIKRNAHLFPLRKAEPEWPDAVKQCPGFSMENLKDQIQKKQPFAAINIYEKLKEEGQSIDLEVQNDLLDLVAYYGIGNAPTKSDLKKQAASNLFYGTVDLPTQEFQKEPTELEIIFSTMATDVRKDHKWRPDNFAERMFQSMEEKDGVTYTAFILGLLKHDDYSRAFEVYEKMRSEGLEGTTYLYNKLLEALTKRAGKFEGLWDEACNLLKRMEDSKVKPDVVTFNCLMRLCLSSSNNEPEMAKLIKIMGEMYHLDIEPSLASYYYILQAAGKRKKEEGKKVLSGTLNSIVLQLEKRIEKLEISQQAEGVSPNAFTTEKLFEVREKDDTKFFPEALTIAMALKDIAAMKRIFNMLMFKAKNSQHVLLGPKFNVILLEFLNILITFEVNDAENVLPYYAFLIPNVLKPAIVTYEELFKCLERCNQPEYIPLLYKELMSSQLQIPINTYQSIVHATGRLQNVSSHVLNPRAFLDLMLDIHKTFIEKGIMINLTFLDQIVSLHALCGNAEATWNSLNYFKLNGYMITPDAAFTVIKLLGRKNYKSKIMALIRFLADNNVRIPDNLRTQLWRSANFTLHERNDIEFLVLHGEDRGQHQNFEDWVLPEFSKV